MAPTPYVVIAWEAMPARETQLPDAGAAGPSADYIPEPSEAPGSAEGSSKEVSVWLIPAGLGATLLGGCVLMSRRKQKDGPKRDRP